MRPWRSLAIAAALAVATTACGPGSDGVADRIGDVASDAVDDLASELATPPAGDDGGGTGADTGGDGTTGGGTGGAGGNDGAGDGGGAGGDDGTGGNGGDVPATTPADDRGGVGANGRAMLRGDRPTMVIEVDVQEGLSPDSAALSHLVDQLGAHADKRDIRLEGGNTFASDRTEWTRQDLRAVADAHRSTATTGDTVSLYLLYVRGGYHADGERTNAVGLAHSASEIALFPDRWSGLGAVVGSDRQVERAVLVHELGHVLGLVNLTYDSAIDHEDPEHPGHSRNRGSVMFWAVETTLIGQVFSGPPPDTFDADDAADLEGLRTGRY